MGRSHPRGFTLIETLTALVVVVVLTAIAIPLYRSHQLRLRRTDASMALMALQAAQDRHFGRHTRYADGSQLTQPPPAGLGLSATSGDGHYALELRAAADGLGYVATARAAAKNGQHADLRCAQMSIDHNGQRRAHDADGADRSQDCWR
jgi:type IV pilus assembly protein PilE